MEDFDMPDVEKIVATILSGLVPDRQIGPMKIDPMREYIEWHDANRHDEGIKVEDFDFIQIKRRMGYLNDSMTTEVCSVDIDVWAKTRDRAVYLIHEATKRLLWSEGTTVNGHQICHVETLNGPEQDSNVMTYETNIVNTLEFQIDVRWK